MDPFSDPFWTLLVKNTTRCVADRLTISGMSTDDSGMKLPRYVQKRPWGSFRYKRNVPKRLLSLMGRTHLYRNLGQSYEEMIRKLPRAHQEVEALFRKVEAETERDRTLAVVESHFGKEAAEMLGAGHIDENLECGLLDLFDRLEGTIDPNIASNVLNCRVPDEIISLSTAFDLYADFKDADQNKKLFNSLTKTKDDLMASIGSVKFGKLPLADLRRDDALKYRDFLLERVSPNSVTRYINIVRAVVNHTIDERGLPVSNPFHNLKVKGAGNGAGDRLPLSAQEALAGFDAMGTRTDLKAIYLALWETGARVAEITGLQVQDVRLQDRSLRIQSNDIRGLKTASSERLLPMSDQLVAALQDHRQGKLEEEPIFDRYGRVGGNTAASALMMKRFRKVISDPKKTLHSLRHKKKDDLRNIGCPEEISKVLLGHSSVEVAARYGAGFKLDLLRDWLARSSQVGGLTS